MAKKKNPSDLTKRNNDARKKEIAALQRDVSMLYRLVRLQAQRKR